MPYEMESQRIVRLYCRVRVDAYHKVHEVGLLDVSGQEILETVSDDGQSRSRSAGLAHHAFDCTDVLVALLISQMAPVIMFESVPPMQVCVHGVCVCGRIVLGLAGSSQMNGHLGVHRDRRWE